MLRQKKSETATAFSGPRFLRTCPSFQHFFMLFYHRMRSFWCATWLPGSLLGPAGEASEFSQTRLSPALAFWGVPRAGFGVSWGSPGTFLGSPGGFMGSPGRFLGSAGGLLEVPRGSQLGGPPSGPIRASEDDFVCVFLGWDELLVLRLQPHSLKVSKGCIYASE